MRARGAATTLLGGRLQLLQPEVGYRVNVDSLLLAAFAATRAEAEVVDLGAGVGGLALAFAHLAPAPPARLWLLERDRGAASLARANARREAARFGIPAADWRTLVHDLACGQPPAPRGSAQLVLCNPPYFEPGSGTARGAVDQAAARSGALLPFVLAARVALGRRGRACFCYPARQAPEFLAAASRAGLYAKRLRFVHARAAAPARLLLAELKPARPGGLTVEAPLVEWREDGGATDEVTRWLGAGVLPPPG